MDYPNLYKVMDEFGKDLVAELRRELAEKGKNATGNLINSLSYRLVSVEDGFEIEINSEEYLKNVDKGRQPGKMPPSNKLMTWVEARGIKMANKKGGVMTTQQAAFVIARAIGRKGINPTNVVESSRKYVMELYKSRIQEALGEDMHNYIKITLLN